MAGWNGWSFIGKLSVNHAPLLNDLRVSVCIGYVQNPHLEPVARKRAFGRCGMKRRPIVCQYRRVTRPHDGMVYTIS